MKFNRWPSVLKWALPVCFIVLTGACEEDDEIDTTLRVLSQQINGEDAVNGMTQVNNDVAIEIIFSHELNTSALESALTLTGSGGAAAYQATYANTNSTLTLSTATGLDFDETYTLSLAAGAYGARGETLDEAFTFTFTTAAPLVSVRADNTSLEEDGGTATVTASISGIFAEPVEVELAFGGTATEGADFMASATTLSIPVGQTETTITLTTLSDGTLEGTEEIEVSVAQATGPFEFDGSTLSISIVDEDIDSNGDGVADQGFIINEILYDPPSGEAGDANGDGTRDANEDEFVEFINDSDVEVDLSGFTVYDASALEANDPRHTFPAGTVVPPGGVYVLFGGGAPSGDFGNAQVGVADANRINLNNGGDVLTILDLEGNVFLKFDSEVEGAGFDFGLDQSLTRSPDVNGGLALHLDVNADLAFSPGKLSDGSNYGGNAGGGGGGAGAGFVINEILYDPAGGEAGDANGDGTREAQGDEFIEFVNDSDEAVDLSGFTVYDTDQLGSGVPRHTFPAGTVVPAGGVYVLFGGGAPSGDFGGAQVGVADPGPLNLNNGGDAITIFDAGGEVFLTFDSATDGEGLDFGSDQSITRSPDVEGGFTLHTTANAGLIFSPGTKADGTPF